MRILVLLFTLCASSAFAAGIDGLKSLTSFRATFEQENRYEGVESFVSKGEVYVEKGYKVLWDYEEPDEYYLIDREGVLYYSAELKQAILHKVDPTSADQALTLLLAFFFDGAALDDRFNVVEKGNELTLTPKEYVGIESVVVTMDGDKPVSMVSKDSSGASVTIRFSNIEANKPIDRKIFERQLPEGTDYIED